MVRTIKSLGHYRGWRRILTAGAMSFVATLAAVLIVDLILVPISALSIVLAAAVGGLVGFCWVGTVSAVRTVQAIGALNTRREVALDSMIQGLCVFDSQYRLVVWNEPYRVMYGLDARGLKRGASLRDLLIARQAAGTFAGDVDDYIAALKDKIGYNNTFAVDIELPDGRTIAVIDTPTPDGGWIATHEDITERKRAERELDHTRAFLDTIIENVPSPIMVKGIPDLKYLLVNRAAEDYLGIDRRDVLGKTSARVFNAETAEMIDVADRQLIAAGGSMFRDEHAVVTPGNGLRIVTSARLQVVGTDNKPQYLITVIRDVTERKRHEQRIAHLAHHDQLTELPNRAAFNECIAATVDMANAQGDSFAVLSVDLDRFKAVNDVFGHKVGDALLHEVARRMEAVCQGAFLARIGGDEFSIITSVGPQPSSAEAMAERLSRIFENDIVIDSHSMRMGVTIGVAVFPEDGADASVLVANADAALFRAKSEARGSIRFFDMSMDTQLRERRALQQDLRKAIENNELELHYQPQANIDGTVTGFEALARWHHPRRGLVPPTDFIPLAEESGIIGALGEWVLRTACREAATWPKPLTIAVNLSPVQFQHGDLSTLVHQVLLETGLPPARLELEITEGVLIGDFARAVSILRRLKNLGVRIAMDDFGTGYSSLSYLQAFPFDKIKIDRAFVINLGHSQQSATIIRAVIALSRGLDVPVIAEGVETEEQRRFLAGENCAGYQGYLIGRPKPIADYAETVGRTVIDLASRARIA
ncbi:MAG: EAL domain-containing protein [Rhodopseudomonas sp.]|nr:EAL domain-containing protein [Rhodopseudomonas sp.]